ncbi:MAG: heme-binding domain-containing protein [Myxococcota bacterium]
MKQPWQVLAAVVVVGLVLLQLIQPERNVATAPSPEDLMATHEVPAAVRTILETACYDCHSDTTRYPWYASIQPIAWLIDHDVREGKTELNFSEFGEYSPQRLAHKLEEIVEETQEGHMPPGIYVLMHPEAALSQQQLAQLKTWAEGLAAQQARD